jgi:Ca2+/Na+ antiporter
MGEFNIERILQAEQKLAERVQSKGFKTWMLSAGGWILLLLAVIVSYVTIDANADINLLAIGVTTVITFVCVYGYHTVQMQKGKFAGEETSDYQEQKEHYKTATKEFRDNGWVLPLEEFCLHSAEYSLEFRRKSVLNPYKVDYDKYIETYSKLKKKEVKALNDLTSEQKKAVISANKLKLNIVKRKDVLRASYEANASDYDISMSAEQATRKSNAVRFFTQAIMTAFSVFIGWQITADFSIEAVIRTIIQVCLVVFWGIRGYVFGYNAIAQTETGHLQSQCLYLSQAKIWIEEQNKIKHEDGAAEEQSSTETAK